MDKDYREKIKKLLALAESPNEHEARAALLKARELMAEHKIKEEDLQDTANRKVNIVKTKHTCSKRKNPWVVDVATVIGENYCCQAVYSHKYGKQTNTIEFIGLDEDIDICIMVFNYAMDCALSQIKRIEEDNDCYYKGYVRRLCNSYGKGFAIGLITAFEEQNEQKADETEWGLVLQMPQEVKDATAGIKQRDFNPMSADSISSKEFMNGYMDGTEFDPDHRLEATI